MKLTLTTNKKSTKIENPSQAKTVTNDAMKTALAATLVKGLAKTAETSRKRAIMIIATFFLRLCARTPLDETYINPHAPIWDNVHKPDDDYARYSWYIKIKGIKIKASDIVAEFGADIFQFAEDKRSADFIETFIDRHIPKNYIPRSFTIGSTTDPKKLKILEYGGYEPKDSKIKDGPTEKHGIKSGYSVQQPGGMLRITKAELALLSEKVAKTNLASRYANSTYKRQLNKKKLALGVTILKRGGKVYVRDLEELVK